MTTFNSEQLEALNIALRYATYDPEAWYDRDTKDIKKMVQIVYDRPAKAFECDCTGAKHTARVVLQDAIARYGFFAPPPDKWKIGFYAYTVISTVATVAAWGYLYWRG